GREAGSRGPRLCWTPRRAAHRAVGDDGPRSRQPAARGGGVVSIGSLAVSTEGPTRSPHRAWIEVDHAATAHNLAVCRDLAGAGKQVIGVVKANAYGHG